MHAARRTTACAVPLLLRSRFSILNKEHFATSQELVAPLFEGHISVAENEGEANEVLGNLRKERVLGFTTRRNPSVRGKSKNERLPISTQYGGMTAALMDFPSLLQIVGRNTALLIRLPILQRLPSALRELIEDGNVLKVGVDVMHDVQLLQRSEFERHGLELWANGFMDVYSLCTTLGPTAGLFASGGHTRGTQEGAQPQQRSVHDLVPLAFGGRKLWDRKLELSDWEAKSLTPEQQRYAASVAWVGREMLRMLYERERGAHRDNLLKYLQEHCTLPIDKENLFP